MIKREQGEGGVGGLDEDDGPIFTNILLPEAPPGAPTASAPGIAGLRRSSSKNNTPVMMGMGIGIAIKPDQQGSPGYMMMKPPDGSGLYYHYENWVRVLCAYPSLRIIPFARHHFYSLSLTSSSLFLLSNPSFTRTID